MRVPTCKTKHWELGKCTDSLLKRKFRKPVPLRKQAGAIFVTVTTSQATNAAGKSTNTNHFLLFSMHTHCSHFALEFSTGRVGPKNPTVPAGSGRVRVENISRWLGSGRSSGLIFFADFFFFPRIINHRCCLPWIMVNFPLGINKVANIYLSIYLPIYLSIVTKVCMRAACTAACTYLSIG